MSIGMANTKKHLNRHKFYRARQTTCAIAATVEVLVQGPMCLNDISQCLQEF